MSPTKEEWIKALNSRHGEELQNRFSSATVAVCGLGGLGSNIAIALGRAGIGRQILIDYDKVELTNLNRQQYKANQIGKFKTEALAENLMEINPYIDIKIVTEKITEENLIDVLSGAEVICEAFDGAEAKAMLVDGVLEHFPQRYLVSASGMAGIGTANTIRTRKITKHFYLCGDETSDVTDTIGLVAPRVMLCASHQAHTVLRILSGNFEV